MVLSRCMILNRINSILLLIVISIAINAQPCGSFVILSTNVNNPIIRLDSIVFENNSTVFLERGKYYLEVYPNDKKWNNLKKNYELFVGECDDTIDVKIIFDDKVLLNGGFDDFPIYYKDSLIGYTPLLIEKTFFGSSLMVNGTHFKLDDNYKSKNEFNFSDRNKSNFTSFVDKPIFKILSGAMIILGGTAAYYKNKADKYFDNYLAKGNKSDLDATNKYDLISGIAFGLLQVNFGYFIYNFLIE